MSAACQKGDLGNCGTSGCASLLVCWRKSYGAVIDESLKAAVALNVPHLDCCGSAKEVSLECRRTVLFYQSALVALRGNQSESRML
jgi:hypothetical protein